MLYDNAQLLPLLAWAWQATGDGLFDDAAARTVAWLQRDMRRDTGAFAASLDADSEGEEGRYYVWTRDEVIAVLGREDGALFADVYDIHAGGNWEGKSIPNLLSAGPLPPADVTRLDHLRDRLLAHRSARTPPALDDKILADWNGLMIAGLADAGAIFGRGDWIGLAEGAYRCLMSTMRRDGRLAHSFRGGKMTWPGLATDHAAVAKAALALHAATFEPHYLVDAEDLAAAARRHYWNDTRPGYYLSADDAEALIIRPPSVTDEATPSATSLMVQNLVRLWRLTGKDAYRADADAILAASGGEIAGNLFATAGLLNALDLRLGAVDVVIVMPPDGEAQPMLEVVRAAAQPNVVLSLHRGATDLAPAHPAHGKAAVDGRATAYVCRGETCSLPVTEPAALARLLQPETPVSS
jgi:uncharacterized protein YyaL (SSP411 family)